MSSYNEIVEYCVEMNLDFDFKNSVKNQHYFIYSKIIN